VPVAGAPKADLPSTGPGIDDAWINFPKQAFKSVQETPGRGGDVSVVSGSAWPPFTPADQNPMLQELNKRLNVNLKLDITTISDYNTKFNTLVAGGNLPDVFWVGQTPNLVDFLKQQCADLTPYLAGDAVKTYPNLANLNTTTWKGTVFGGAIMGLPSPLGAMGNIMQVNKTRWDAEVGADVKPKNADDLKKILQQLTNPQANKWAIASGSTDPYGAINGWFAMMYGAPNNWGMENGRLINFRESQGVQTVDRLPARARPVGRIPPQVSHVRRGSRQRRPSNRSIRHDPGHVLRQPRRHVESRCGRQSTGQVHAARADQCRCWETNQLAEPIHLAQELSVPGHLGVQKGRP
jgi:putative aldouronate transport system substrate-binding protein